MRAEKEDAAVAAEQEIGVQKAQGQQLHDPHARRCGGAVSVGGISARNTDDNFHSYQHVSHLPDRPGDVERALAGVQFLHFAELPAQFLYLLRDEQTVPGDVQAPVHGGFPSNGARLFSVHDACYGERENRGYWR